MTATEIKKEIDNGNKVYYKSSIYEVIKDGIGQYLIKCIINGHCIGLTWQDGETLNGKEGDFYVENRA